MLLNIELVSILIDPLVSMARVSVHKSETLWGSSIGEEDCSLVETLWMQGPEVPSSFSARSASSWMWLLGVDEVWEFDGISDEEDWSVVTNHIIDTFFSVELDCKSSWISL